MIDRVSSLGYLEIQTATTAATGANTGVFNLISTQAQGRVAFYMDAAASAVAGATMVTYLQTSSDNSNWTNVVFAANGLPVTFTTVTNVANTGGLQALYKNTETDLLNYNRFSTTVTGTNANFTQTIFAVYVKKNPT